MAFPAPVTPAITPASLSIALASPLVGTLPNPAAGILYTVPAKYKTVMFSLEVFNSSGGTANVTLYININGVDFPLRGAALASLSQLLDTLSRALPAGTIIKGVSDVAGATYVLQIQEIPQ